MASETRLEMQKKQAALLEALMSCATVKAAAQQAGISLRTAYRWTEEDEEFRQEFKRARQAAVDHTAARLSECGSRSVGVLDQIANDETVGASVRVAAAGKLVDCVLKLSDMELADRLDQIEATFAAARGERP